MCAVRLKILHRASDFGSRFVQGCGKVEIHVEYLGVFRLQQLLGVWAFGGLGLSPENNYRNLDRTPYRSPYRMQSPINHRPGFRLTCRTPRYTSPSAR